MAKKEKWRTGLDGVLELVDEETGKVIFREKKGPKNKVPLTKQGGTFHYVIDNAGRTVWCPKGTNPDDLPHVVYPYSEVTCSLILEKIASGMLLTQVCRLEGMPPYHVVNKWLLRYPDFKALMKEARLAKGEFYADKAIETAEEADEDNVQAHRLKVDTYKWAAEVNDRNTYGKNVKVSGDAEQPVAFMISTGIVREEKLVVQAEVKAVEDDSDGE